jgi:hypothetical protein
MFKMHDYTKNKIPPPTRNLMGTHDRLIFNAAGESVLAICLPGQKVRIQINGLSGYARHDTHGIIQTVEVELGRREVLAFILQIGAMPGVAVEIRDGKPLTQSQFIERNTP